jgi:phosphohistidine swiveling domain-containing protein
MLFWLRDLAAMRPAPDEVGGKARHLALLCAAGLPVPDGFVLPASALRALRTAGGEGDRDGAADGDGDGAADGDGDGDGDGDALAGAVSAAAQLGPVLAVRSSSVAEDRAEGAAPGLFSSRLDIRPADLRRAVREVLASADSLAVRAYLARHGPGEPADIAVIVQRQVRGASGVLYTRAPGAANGDELCVEAAAGALASSAVARRSDGQVLSRDPDFPLTADELSELVRLGLAAETAIGAGAQPGADVEWVAEDGPPGRHGPARRKLWLVQARPIRRAPPAVGFAAEELAFSRGDPHTVWRWDASHNPDPLSPAQTGLVEWVAPVARAPMRVVDGYLSVASRDAATPGAPPTADELEAVFAGVRDDIEAALAPVEQGEPDLGAALAAYRAVYEAYMVRLTPALSRARAALDPSTSQVRESAVARAARTGDRAALEALSPVWDVAAATFEEDSEALDRALAQLGAEPTAATDAIDTPDPPDAHAGSLRAEADLARAVRTIGEADDLLFFRAQRAVRRALLGLSRSWRLAPPDDIFYLPLDQIRAAAEHGTPIDPDDARPIARQAREIRDARRGRAAPLAVRDGRPIAAVGGGGLGLDFWRGRSAGSGSARGPVLRVVDLGRIHSDPHDRVIVARSITPAAVVQLAGAAALVCEQGGVLDHAAALARELAIPCVVGCSGAWHALREQDQVLVDGDAGLVVRLGLGDRA